MFNPNKVKKGDLLGIGSVFSKKTKDYVPIQYKVTDIIDIDTLPNIKKQGVTHIFYILSPKNKLRDLTVFKKKNFYFVGDEKGKTYSKGKLDAIKTLAKASAKKDKAEIQMIDTEKELKKGLKQFVYDYIKARQLGNIKLAKQLKKKLDKLIKQKNLNAKMVYTYYGDPDKPGFKLPTKANVKTVAELKELYSKNPVLAQEVAEVLGYRITSAKSKNKVLVNILLDDLDKAAETELGNQKLPSKSKLIKLIESAINVKVDELMYKIMKNSKQRDDIIKEVITSIINYF